jgi:ribosomal protein L11 methyltransferase
MKPRHYYQLSVRISPEAEEAVAELFLSVLGTPASITTNARTGRTVAQAFLQKPVSPAKSDLLRRGLAGLKACGLFPGATRIQVRRLRSEDWAESWKRHFKPLEIGTRLLIKPSWHRKRPRGGQALLELDPGLSFGTGQHPTTHFCLTQLVAKRGAQRQSMLDIGTGSGILALAAAKLGYSPVEGWDFDPDCIRIAKENAARNGLGRAVRFARKDLRSVPIPDTARHDVVCANLTADLLIEQAHKIARHVKPGGVVLLAGILKKQFDQVRDAFVRQGLKPVASRIGGEWRSGSFARER